MRTAGHGGSKLGGCRGPPSGADGSQGPGHAGRSGWRSPGSWSGCPGCSRSAPPPPAPALARRPRAAGRCARCWGPGWCTWTHRRKSCSWARQGPARAGPHRGRSAPAKGGRPCGLTAAMGAAGSAAAMQASAPPAALPLADRGESCSAQLVALRAAACGQLPTTAPQSSLRARQNENKQCCACSSQTPELAAGVRWRPIAAKDPIASLLHQLLRGAGRASKRPRRDDGPAAQTSCQASSQAMSASSGTPARQAQEHTADEHSPAGPAALSVPQQGSPLRRPWALRAADAQHPARMRLLGRNSAPRAPHSPREPILRLQTLRCSRQGQRSGQPCSAGALLSTPADDKVSFGPAPEPLRGASAQLQYACHICTLPHWRVGLPLSAGACCSGGRAQDPGADRTSDPQAGGQQRTSQALSPASASVGVGCRTARPPSQAGPLPCTAAASFLYRPHAPRAPESGRCVGQLRMS